MLFFFFASLLQQSPALSKQAYTPQRMEEWCCNAGYVRIVVDAQFSTAAQRYKQHILLDFIQEGFFRVKGRGFQGRWTCKVELCRLTQHPARSSPTASHPILPARLQLQPQSTRLQAIVWPLLATTIDSTVCLTATERKGKDEDPNCSPPCAQLILSKK